MTCQILTMTLRPCYDMRDYFVDTCQLIPKELWTSNEFYSKLNKDTQKFKNQNRLTSLDFNYVKPCLDLIELKLQLLTL